MQLDLVFLANNTETSRVTLSAGEFVIGRDSACEIVVESDEVSRRHARLTVNDAEVFIEDLGSANGTFINGDRTEGRASLVPGQRVQLGAIAFEARWQPASGPTLHHETPGDAESPERVLRGRKYEMGDVVATGGMGVVRRANDLHVRRAVAVKSMSEAGVSVPAKRSRFVEEAQVTGQLEHPNIVPVYDLGVDDAGRPFYTMKLVRGITLKTVLDDILNLKADTIAQFPLGRLLTIFQKACDAVAFAHSKGIIHRDLKPDNIMIGDFGEVLVLDWGLAKRTGRMEDWMEGKMDEPIQNSKHRSHQTASGSVMGTPHFMSPEQAGGFTGQIDERTDIFALGGVLYNILTLQPPFPGETAQDSIRMIRAGHIITPAKVASPLPHCPGRKIPASLAAVAMMALAMKPDHRYQTVRELQKDLEAFQGGFATSAEQAGTFKLFVLLIRRRKIEFLITAVAFVALLAVGGAALARIVVSERHARESLAALRAAAPAYESQAASLIEEHDFTEALEKVTTALELTPEKPDLYVLKGNVLESLLQLTEARDAYAAALKLDAGNAAARQNLALCEKLLRENAGRDELLPASLNELQQAMLRQQRSAEALAMVRQLDKDTQTLYETWKTVLEREGVLEKTRNTSRLIVDDAGRFYLNLNRTKIDDISALKDMPLKELHLMQTQVRDLSPLRGSSLLTLNLAGTPVSDLEPLRGSSLKVLVLAGCRNLTDVTALCDCRQLETLILPPAPGNIECLHRLPKLTRISSPQRLALAREEIARRFGRPAPAFLDEAMPAADFWREHDRRGGQ